MNVESSAGRWTCALFLEKDDYFEIEINGETRTVHQVKAVMTSQQVHIPIKLTGSAYPTSYTVKPGDLPVHIWEQIVMAYEDWRASLPAHLPGP